MLFTITTRRQPATDLGYLLHKHPAKVQKFKIPYGEAVVFYSEASDEATTAALMLNLEPLELVKADGRGGGFGLGQYVNDRPYVAGTLLSSAIAEVYRSAMNGTCKDKPHLVEQNLPCAFNFSAINCPKGDELCRKLFEPLGYKVETTAIRLEATHPEWGAGSLFSLRLEADMPLSLALKQIYILIPVLDHAKHYDFGATEIEKLTAKGEKWLADHPEKELIIKRYLMRRHKLVDDALAKFVQAPDELEIETVEETESETPKDAALKPESEANKKVWFPLHEQRLEKVTQVLKELGATTVLDLGCGEGKLLRKLKMEHQFQRIGGVDVSIKSLQIASKNLRLSIDSSVGTGNRFELWQSSATMCDERAKGYDAVALVEVMEHLDPERLPDLADVLFAFLKPKWVVLTTPNSRYNAVWESLPAGTFRHDDHRFEWNEAELAAWATEVAQRYDYSVRIEPLGELNVEFGAPSQLAVFIRK